jgi:hypothetical protein
MEQKITLYLKLITKPPVMSRFFYSCISFFLFSGSLFASTGESVYQFLELPVSSLAAGAGGNNVSSPESDLNLTFHNPALLSSLMNNQMEFGYMNYISDINAGSFAYSRKINDNSQWMAGIRYVDYGSMPWTNEQDELLGTTYAKDLAITGAYSWKLSERWRAGSSISLVYSVLDEYVSAAVAVDLGVHYYNPDNFFSAGITLKNLGSQIVSYDEQYESMPWDIRLGISKKLAHAPFRFNFTVQHLNERSFTYLEKDSDTENDLTGIGKIADNIFSRVIAGVDFIPSDNFLLNIGYNYRRASQLGINQRTFFGGFTAGFMIRMKQIRAGASFARYHIGGSSLQMTISLNSSIIGL